tara:strand:+ start:72 stop:905 length:834 start_codon:yes stop_codon:yes gene_type:complete
MLDTFLMNVMTGIYTTYFFVAIILIALIAIITGVLSILSNEVPQDIKDKYKDIDFDFYERGGWNPHTGQVEYKHGEYVDVASFTPQGRAMNMLNGIWFTLIMIGVVMILGTAFDDETPSFFGDNPGAFIVYLVFFFALVLEVPELILFRRDSRPWYLGGWLPKTFLIFLWCVFLYGIIKAGFRGLFELLIELTGLLGIIILGFVALLLLAFTFFSLLEKYSPKTYAWFEIDDDGYERPGTMAEQKAKWKKIIDKEKKEQQTKTTVKRKKLTKKTAKK